MADNKASLNLEIPSHFEGVRADKALAELLPEYSRATIQGLIKQGNILCQGKTLKPSGKFRGNETLEIIIPPPRPAEWEAQQLPLEVIYQDPHLFVLNKAPGLVVHPGAGNPDGTLLNGLLYLDQSLRTLPRAGIVHRLDKDTSGLMVVARTELARQSLIRQLKDHTVSRQYIAIAIGIPVTGETIDQPIGRHHHDRLRMAVTERGKPAITHVRVRRKFRSHSLLEAALETGRTHQIRVHLSWRGYPLVGDSTYGGRVKLPPDAGSDLISTLQGFDRQALHARALSLSHPATGEPMLWQQDIPMDMQILIDLLELDLGSHRIGQQ